VNAYELCGDETPAFVSLDGGETLIQAKEVSFQVGKGLIVSTPLTRLERQVLADCFDLYRRIQEFWVAGKSSTEAEIQLGHTRVTVIDGVAEKLGIPTP
jgi:hypothetical protein